MEPDVRAVYTVVLERNYAVRRPEINHAVRRSDINCNCYE